MIMTSHLLTEDICLGSPIATNVDIALARQAPNLNQAHRPGREAFLCES